MNLINYNRLVVMMLPIRKRKPAIMAFLQCLITTISYTYDQIRDKHNAENYTGNKYRVKYGSQVCHLQKILNEALQLAYKTIYIDNAEKQLAIELYTEGGGNELKLYTEAQGNPIELYSKAESGGTGYDFAVVVPSAIWYGGSVVYQLGGGNVYSNQVLIKSLLNTNKLASKQYLIKII